MIARIDAARELGPAPLRNALLQTLSRMTGEMAAQAGRPAEEIVLTVLAGNTCMHHLALGLSPASLGLAPYLPVLREPLLLPADGWTFPSIPPDRWPCCPNLAGFVGADTAACLLAGDFARREALTLLLDIGTNGELVLGNRGNGGSPAPRPPVPPLRGPGSAAACGAPRGPSTTSIWRTDAWSVMSSERARPGASAAPACWTPWPPCWTAGSWTSRAACWSPRNSPIPGWPPASPRWTGPPLFSWLRAPEPGGEPVVLTQKDIRELQLAKGAIAAGIHLLAQVYGAELEDIQTVLIAGAFGNFMRPESACRIGLIPPQLLGKIRPVGNAAGEGACLAALSRVELSRCASLAAGTEYLELAQHPGFSACYMEEMGFPERQARPPW